MITFQSLVLLAALAVPGQTVLVEFYSDGCAPCRSMEPTIRRLSSEGFAVRRVNVAHDPQLTRQFRVDHVPTYVMVANGQEADRVVGPASYERLRQMIGSAMPGSGAAKPPASAITATAAQGAKPDPQRQALHATVRLRIQDATGSSSGTGTVIDARENEALVITCGHLFRDSSGQGEIEVDLFAPGASQPVPGKVLSYDLDKDVALVAIWPDVPVVPVRVAPPGTTIRRGDRVFSIGCDRGDDPTIWPSQVTSINKFLGPANIQVAGQPVIGRSGGGLFSRDGLLIGVCNAADPIDNEGLYAALPVLHEHLAANLPQEFLMQNILVADAGGADPASGVAMGAADPPPAMPQNMPAVAAGDAPPMQTLPAGAAATSPDDLLAWLQSLGDDAEVICIVRSKSDPRGARQLLIFDNPSRDLLGYLAAQQRSEQASPTRVAADPQQPATLAGPPNRHESSTATPVLRGQR